MKHNDSHIKSKQNTIDFTDNKQNDINIHNQNNQVRLTLAHLSEINRRYKRELTNYQIKYGSIPVDKELMSDSLKDPFFKELPPVIKELDYLVPLFRSYDERQRRQQWIIETYAEQIDTIRKESDQAIQESKNLRNQMEVQSEELLQIYTKNLNNGETVSILDESEKKTYENRIQILKNAVNSLQGQIKNIQLSQSNQKEQWEEEMKRNESLLQKVDSKKKELKQLERQFNLERERHKKDVKALQHLKKKHQQLENNYNTIEERVKQLTHHNKLVNKELNLIKQRQHDKLNKVKTELKALKFEHSALKDKSLAQSKSVLTLQKGNHVYTNQSKYMKTQIDDLTKENEQLKGQYDQYEEQNFLLVQEKEDINNKMKIQKTKLVQKNKELKQQQKQNNDNKTEIQKLQKSVRMTKNEVKLQLQHKFEDQVRDQQIEIEELKSQTSVNQTMHQKQKMTLQDAEKELKQLRRQIVQQQAKFKDISVIQKQNERLKNQINQRDQESEGFQKQVEDLKQQLLNSNEDLIKSNEDKQNMLQELNKIQGEFEAHKVTTLTLKKRQEEQQQQKQKTIPQKDQGYGGNDRERSDRNRYQRRQMNGIERERELARETMSRNSYDRGSTYGYQSPNSVQSGYGNYYGKY